MSTVSIPAVTGYSAKVRLELHVGTVCYPLAQIGGDRLILTRDVELPGKSGEVRAHVDDQVHRWLATWEASDSPRRVVRATFRHLT